MSTLIQSVGLGGLKPNTVLISWPRSDEIYNDEYATFMGRLFFKEKISIKRNRK